MSKDAKPTRAKPDYIPTSQELAVLAKAVAREKSAAPAPRFKIENNRLSPDHAEPALGYLLLREALGAADRDFTEGLIKQVADATLQGSKANEDALNFLVSVVKSIRPRDQVEAMLAAQMGIIHLSTMKLGQRLMNAENVPQQDSAERALNKLTRTFAAQMEALKRYRAFGDQTASAPVAVVDDVQQPVAGGDKSQSQQTIDQKAAVSSQDASSASEEAPKVVPMKRGSGAR